MPKQDQQLVLRLSVWLFPSICQSVFRAIAPITEMAARTVRRYQRRQPAAVFWASQAENVDAAPRIREQSPQYPNSFYSFFSFGLGPGFCGDKGRPSRRSRSFTKVFEPEGCPVKVR